MTDKQTDDPLDTRLCCLSHDVVDCEGTSRGYLAVSASPNKDGTQLPSTIVGCGEAYTHSSTTYKPSLLRMPLGNDVTNKTMSNQTQPVLTHAKSPVTNLVVFNNSQQDTETTTCPILVENQKLQSCSKQRRAQSRKPAVQFRKNSSSKVRKRVPQEMQAQWRVGAAPSVALAISREESQISKVISQATAFHKSMFEVYWGPKVCESLFIFDLDNRVELFRDSSVTAACLVAAGKPHVAREVLNRVLPSIDDLLRNPPPALYLILAESALGLVKTPNDLFRDQVVKFVASRALAVLGAEHPLTTLLTLRLPLMQKEELGDRLWRIIIPILDHSFGPDHYQSSTQVFCQARNMASRGQLDEAIRILEKQIGRWIELYGGNSLIVCYSKIELANILISAGSYMKAEFVVSDALRTSDMIHAAELRDEDCPASEKRHRKSSIAFPRVAALRTLGRLHCLRGNLSTALYYYSQAIVVGGPSLGMHSAVIELAQTDLNSTRALEVKQNSRLFSPSEIASLTNIVPSPIS